jgi:serine/threonine-protein kinase
MMGQGGNLGLVDNRYRLVRMLGEGAAGAVWLAHDERLEIDVALKILRAKVATKETIARFLREAELAERMLSPHIVRVLARGVDTDDAPYIVYELLDGDDLSKHVSSNRRLSLQAVRTVVVHTCRALARAHSIGVLHRDIKPENLFVTKSEGRSLLKVLDFGVAEVVAAADREGPIVGTLEYMAPEVVLGERPPSVQSDLFSLAVVAYQCLSGSPPFRADNIGQLVLAHATTTPKRVRNVDYLVPLQVDKWFERALARDPDARFESARDMAGAFESAVSVVKANATGVFANLDPNFMRRRESSQYVIVTPRESSASLPCAEDAGEKEEQMPPSVHNARSAN